MVAASATSGTVIAGGGTFKSLPRTLVAHQMQCKMFAFCNICLAFSGADIEFDFVLMTSVYSQYLKDSCKWHLTLAGS